MERWVEHYTELNGRENVVTEDTLNVIKCLPELEELDREPTIDGLNEAPDSLVVCLGQCLMAAPIPLHARPQSMSSI